MTLDAIPINITKSLECALRYLRLGGNPRVLWVDAICINQDDTAEKSAQVPRMGDIYKGATTVHACLGEPEREIDDVFSVLQEFRDRKREEKNTDDLDAAELLAYHQELFRTIFRNKARYLTKPSDHDAENLYKEFNWLRPFYTRPYWSRVWIVQEIVLARTVIVYCGQNSIDFDDIYGLSLDWGSFRQAFEIRMHHKSTSQAWSWYSIQAMRDHRRQRELGEVEFVEGVWTFKMSQRADVVELDEVIEIYVKNHSCSCPKDKIYGFRELISKWKSDLVVDYSRSDREVFLDVARLGLLKPEDRGGVHFGSRLWSAMGLGDMELFDEFLEKYFPEVHQQRQPSPDDDSGYFGLSQREIVNKLRPKPLSLCHDTSANRNRCQ